MQSSVGAGDLGRYRLDRLLGAGGMGEVYLAHDLVLPREVAIKFLSAADIDPDTLKRRLVHEAQAVAALDHPSICVVHDVGVDPTGRPFMVMQYVEGETLAARLARSPLAVRDALKICAQIAEALGTAHKRGIVHRDLKPHNVMITPSGAPKLLDFGIAKALPSAESATVSADTASVDMQSHAFAGTPSYMSPEQVLQRPLDGRSDLFSLGCILYESLTGKRPFHGAQTIDVLAQILHAHPPAPSTLRGELDERHDELIRRLMAKEPADRFQSADELVGALRVLQPDTSRQNGEIADEITRRWFREKRSRRPAIAAAIALALAATGFAVWRIAHPSLPKAPPDAERYYLRGTDALREGSFHSAESALAEAIRLFPQYPLAYARLAEAHAEMDDTGAAARDLVRVGELVPNKARLDVEERLRLDAIQFLVLGDVDRAVTAYAQVSRRRANDAGAWVDLGRAQEAAAQVNDARSSYERAVAIDPQYAAAHLRLGVLHGVQNRPKDALAALAEAERLYAATSNKEGETEVLIRRGTVLDGVGEFDASRAALLKALDTARVMGNTSQLVRTQMQLSSVAASQSQFAEAEQLASTAVQTALDSGLDVVAAAAMSKLAAVLSSAGRGPEAETQGRKAIALAEKRGAYRTVALVATQLASVQSASGRPADALRTLDPALVFFKQHKYRELELNALSIAARAYASLDDIARARAVATEALKEAEATGNDYQLSLALNNLATQATTLGALPEALALRERAEAIHRRQKDASQLPYDLTGRADLLIRLGRFADAERVLAEVDEGGRRNLAAYVGRRQRVAFLRALSLTLQKDVPAAASALDGLLAEMGDAAPALTISLTRFVRAKQQRAPLPAESPTPKDPAAAREYEYWSAATALAAGKADVALSTAELGLDKARTIGNDELAWRLAAVGCAAARALRRLESQRSLHSSAWDALRRLRTSWGAAATSYDLRPDLVDLRKAAEL